MLNYSNNNIFEKLETRVLRFTKRKFFQFIFSLDSIMHQVKTRHSQVLDFCAVKQVPLDAQHFKTHELSTFQRFTRIPRDRLKKPF